MQPSGGAMWQSEMLLIEMDGRTGSREKIQISGMSQFRWPALLRSSARTVAPKVMRCEHAGMRLMQAVDPATVPADPATRTRPFRSALDPFPAKARSLRGPGLRDLDQHLGATHVQVPSTSTPRSRAPGPPAPPPRWEKTQGTPMPR